MPAFNEHQFLTQLALNNSELRDDVALISDQLLTKDVLVEGTHFDWSYFTPYDLGWKSVAVNASDIAGTGGVLDGVLIGLVLPQGVDSSAVDSFYQGIADCLATLPFAPEVWGGDTTRGPGWMVSITAIGHIPAGYTAGRRWQAEPGDSLLTTGPHGLSRVGLQAFSQRVKGFDACKRHHLRPQARMHAGLNLAAKSGRYALMDSSDGLADAALKLANASSVGIEIWTEALPVHPEVSQWTRQNGDYRSTLDCMLYGGEDFELVSCWPADQIIPEGWQVIGTVVPAAAPAAWWVFKQGSTDRHPLSYNKTYQHF